MKYLILFILLSGILTGAIAQEKDGIYFSTEKPVKATRAATLNHVDAINVNEMDSITRLQYQLDYVRHCLIKCQHERAYGYGLSILGGLAMGIGMSDDADNVETYGNRTNNRFDGNYVMVITGGVMSLVGTIMIIDSDKWLRRAYIGPNGIGVKFEF